jgi:hypothetical protein
MQYLRETAKANIRSHIEERIPAKYEACLAGLKLILRKTYKIVDDKSKRTEEQLAAMNLAVNMYGKLMDLSTNGAILEKTTKWLMQKKEQLQSSDEPDATEDEEITETEEDVPTEPEEDLREE